MANAHKVWCDGLAKEYAVQLIVTMSSKRPLILIKSGPLVFPQFTRHFSERSLTLSLELMGTELIEMLVASNTIVETLDVIEDF